MATSDNLVAGKKGKKIKKGGKQGTTVPLQNFWLSTPDAKVVGSSEIAKVVPFVSTWADEVEDEEYRAPQTFILPTAPRASREFDDHNIPHNPPFLAYITNLPYDINREEIEMFFDHLSITDIRLPEDGESGRLRGFGYVEFDNREDLIEAVSMPDPHIQNRRIRIEVSNEGDQKRMGRNRGYDNYNNSGGGADRDSTDWRKDRPARDDNDMNGGGGGGGRRGGGDRGYGGYNRDRDRDRQRDSSQDGGGGGNWRAGDRPKMDSPPAQRRGYQDREGYGGDRGGGGGGKDRGDRYGGGGGGRGDRGDRGDRRGGDDREEPQAERPKLNLAPRTLPLPEVAVIPIDDETKSKVDEQSLSPVPSTDDEPPPQPRPTPVPAANIFGSAKPVDTAAKEREIEERLERERLEKRAKEEAERARLAEEREKEKEKAIAEVESSKKDDETEIIKDEPKVDENSTTAVTTEDAKPKAEANSWRRRTDEKTSDSDEYKPRTQSPPRRRYSPARNDRRGGGRDNRDRGYDNRDRGYDNRDRGYDNRDRGYDNRDRGGYDNRDRGYNNRDRGGYDNRDRDYGRDNRDRDGRDNNRDNRDRDGRDNNRDNRDRDGRDHHKDNRDRDNRDHRGDRERGDNRGPKDKDQKGPMRRETKTDSDDSKDIESRMPKYQAPAKPKLQMSNKYDFLGDEDASD